MKTEKEIKERVKACEKQKARWEKEKEKYSKLEDIPSVSFCEESISEAESFIDELNWVLS